MRLYVLGSGTVIPSGGRRATSILVEWEGEHVLLDCGPGALDSIEEAGLSYRDVRRIFLSHYHTDHSLDIGRLLSAVSNDESYPEGRRITIYGPEGLGNFLGNWQLLYPGTTPKRDFPETREIGGGMVLDEGASRISAARVSHGDMPALAYRLEEKGTSIVYTGDTGYDPRLVDLARGADLLVSECSFPDGHEMEGHLTPTLAGRIASEASVRRLLLVHLYPELFRDRSPADIIEAVSLRFDGQIEIGRDGLEIEL